MLDRGSLMTRVNRSIIRWDGSHHRESGRPAALGTSVCWLRRRGKVGVLRPTFVFGQRLRFLLTSSLSVVVLSLRFWSHLWHGSPVLLGRCHRGADPLTLERNRDSSPREVSDASVAATGSRLDERGRPRRHAWDGLSVEMTMGRRISCDLLP